MVKSNKSYRFFICLLFVLLIAERLYGIWFLRWAFDEEQNFGGGTAILKYGLSLLGWEVANPEMEHLVSIYGIVGKYLAVLPAALGFGLEQVFAIDLPIPLGLIFTRVVVSFLPSVLTVYLVWQLVRQMGGGRLMELGVLVLFLFTFKHVETAHYGVSDALSTFFVVLSVYCFVQFSVAIGGKGHRKFLVFLALSSVSTVSTKINVGVVITAVVIVFLMFKHKRGKGEWRDGEVERKGEYGETEAWRKTKWRKEHRDTEVGRKGEGRGGEVVLFAVVWVGAFVMINLPYLWNFSEWYVELLRHVNEYPYTIKGSWSTPFYFRPPFGVGWGILVLAVGGIVVFMSRKVLESRRVSKNIGGLKTLEDWVLLPALCFLVLFYVYLAMSRGVIHRWGIPMTPFLVLFAAYFGRCIYDWSLEFFGVERRNLVTFIGGMGVIGIGIIPLFSILCFNLSLTDKPNTYQRLEEVLRKGLASDECIYNLEGLQIEQCSENAPEDILALEESQIEYIIFSDFWFSERRYPSSILYLEVIDFRTHGNWREIRNYLEKGDNHWRLIHQIEPKYYTHWSTNIAQPPIFYVYRRMPSD